MLPPITRQWYVRVRAFLIVALIAIAGLYTMTTALAFSGSGVLVPGEPTTEFRHFRSGVSSTCAAPKTFPGTFGGSSSHLYDIITYTNYSTDTICVVLGVSSTTAVFSAVYLDAFNPSDLSQNYLADAGASAPLTYSFYLSAGHSALLFFGEVGTGGGGNLSYTYTIPGSNQYILIDPIEDKSYSTPPFPISVTASSGLTIELASNSPAVCTTSETTVTLTGLGTCELVAGQSGNEMVNPAEEVTATFEVLQAPLTVTVDNQTRLYGATNPTFTGTISGMVDGDGITASYGTAATATSPTGSYPIVATLNDPNNKLSNYSVTNTPGTLQIDPTPLTVTADDAQRNEGQPNPTFTATFSGFVNSETVADLDGTLVLTTTADEQSPEGTYPIVPSGLSSANYDITYVNGELTIAPDVPISTLTITHEGQLIVGQVVTFTADAGDATNVVYAWDFGDSQLSVASPVTSHVFAQAGTYTVTVVASNSAGSMSESTTITIADPTALDEVEQPGNPTQIFMPSLRRQEDE